MDRTGVIVSALVQEHPVWVDNGMTFWPPSGWHGLDVDDWPRSCEAWVKYGDEAEHRRIMERRESVRCTTYMPYVRGVPIVRCGDVLPSWKQARRHQIDKHPGVACTFAYVHALWTWQLLGFPEFYWGTPRGWYCVLEGGHVGDTRWEDDALLLGERVADHFRWDARDASS